MKKITIGPCTLHHGDCKQILPKLNHGLVITDPPYGIDFKYGVHKDSPDLYADLIACLTPYPKVVLQYPEEMMRYMVPLWGAPDDIYTWCYNSNTNRQTRLWGFWGIKPNWNAVKQKSKNFGDPRVNDEVRSYDWCSDIQQVKNVSGEKTNHPCQIPLDMMKRIIAFTGAETIIDPFMGSGTTGVACIKMGRKFIGIELDPDYFKIACERIQRAYDQPDMLLEAGV